MRDRLTFLGHFVISLAIIGAAYFASVWDIPQTIWRNDSSYMTSVIGVLFIGTVVYLGRLAWSVGSVDVERIEARSEWGWFIEEKFLRIGLLGTVFGLSMQAEALSTGTAGLEPLSTALFSTAVGILASLLCAGLSYNLMIGIRRAKGARG
jgi:hypothetical protein